MSQLAEFIGNHLMLTLPFIALSFLYIMMFINDKMQAFASINSAELTQLVNHKNAILIDTRKADSFKQGHIVNAVNLPLDDITSGKASIEKYKGKNIITYCTSGMSSKLACKLLIKSGIENVFNLTGGINGWVKDKLPVIKSK